MFHTVLEGQGIDVRLEVVRVPVTVLLLCASVILALRWGAFGTMVILILTMRAS